MTHLKPNLATMNRIARLSASTKREGKQTNLESRRASSRRPSGARAYPNLYVSLKKHEVLWKTGLT